MSLYHCDVKVISRGQGRSAVGAAAYRAGEMITNEYDGIVHDYTRKGGIVYSEIILCENAPERFLNRSILWNEVEQVEKGSKARLAREIEFALPEELSFEQQLSLARDYVKINFVNEGMIADIAIHDKKDGNPHAHVMLTTRPFNERGEWGDKSKKEYMLDKNGQRIKLPSGEWKSRKVDLVDWNTKDKLLDWRRSLAEIINKHLDIAGLDKALHVDSRSYAEQGKDLIPTKHLGPSATALEAIGIKTEIGDYNREVKRLNEEMAAAQLEREKLLAGMPTPEADPPSVLDPAAARPSAATPGSPQPSVPSEPAKIAVTDLSLDIANELYRNKKMIYALNDRIFDARHDLKETHSAISMRLQLLDSAEKRLESIRTLDATISRLKLEQTSLNVFQGSRKKALQSDIDSYTDSKQNVVDSFVRDIGSPPGSEANAKLSKVRNMVKELEALKDKLLTIIKESTGKLESALIEYKAQRVLAEASGSENKIISQLNELERDTPIQPNTDKPLSMTDRASKAATVKNIDHISQNDFNAIKKRLEEKNMHTQQWETQQRTRTGRNVDDDTR